MTSGTKVTPFGPRAARAAGGFLPKTRVVLASSNAGKLRELTVLLAPLGLDLVAQSALGIEAPRDRKSTRLNSSHSQISYAVFCLKKKKDRYCAYSMRPCS